MFPAAEASTSDETQNFNSIAFPQDACLEIFPVDYFEIQFDRDAINLNFQIPKQARHRYAVRRGMGLAVDLNLHRRHLTMTEGSS